MFMVRIQKYLDQDCTIKNKLEGYNAYGEPLGFSEPRIVKCRKERLNFMELRQFQNVTGQKSTYYLLPDTIISLGDYIDEGVVINIEEYKSFKNVTEYKKVVVNNGTYT